MQTRDEVEGLHTNCREFSKRLECLYQSMQTRKKVFYCFYKITFPKQNAKLFVWHWLKEKFLPVAKSCPRSLASRGQPRSESACLSQDQRMRPANENIIIVCVFFFSHAFAHLWFCGPSGPYWLQFNAIHCSWLTVLSQLSIRNSVGEGHRPSTSEKC